MDKIEFTDFVKTKSALLEFMLHVHGRRDFETALSQVVKDCIEAGLRVRVTHIPDNKKELFAGGIEVRVSTRAEKQEDELNWLYVATKDKLDRERDE